MGAWGEKGQDLRRVVVTGIGIISPIGLGKGAFVEALEAGRSGIRHIQKFDTTDYAVKIAGEVPDFDPTDYIERKMVKRLDRYAQYGIGAAVLAQQDADYPIGEDPYAVGALVGSGVGGLDTFYEQCGILIERGPSRVSPFFIPMMIPNMASATVSISLGLKGPVNATCTACAAGTNALGDAFQLVRRGYATAMFAGGAEAAVNQVGVSAFAALRALSTRNDEPERASRPFDAARDGFVMGEGSGVLVLEERRHALDRGAHIYGEILGYGMTGDASHLTEPDETGEPAALAMGRAIADAGILPTDIDYINAHGTSTPLGDVMETRAIHAALGEAATRVMVSSNKSVFGHCLGAAGALEAAATLLAMERGFVAPTLNLENPDPQCDLDYVPLKARKAHVRYAVSNSFGFGGHNAALVFGRGDED